MPDITISPATAAELPEWDAFVAASPHGTLFHRLPWLYAMARESRSELVPLVLRAAQGWAGVLPVFLRSQFGMRALFSPPPGCAVPALGPVVRFGKERRRGMDSLVNAAVGAFDAWVAEQRITHASVALQRGFGDVRPFVWRGFSATTHYEYVVPVTGSEEEIFARFESETRTKVRRAQKHEGLEVRDGGLHEVLELRRMVQERYAAQGLRWNLSEAYVRDVFEAFAPAELGVKVAVSEGEIVTGMVTLYYGGAAQDWIGGFAPAKPLSGVNELLHWALVREARQRGATGYDLGGANTEHLALTKSKYNPDLLPYYHVEKASPAARTVKHVLTTRVGRALYARLK